MKKILIPTLMAALLFAACQHDTKPADADLVVLYTTDVHGACLGFDIKLNAPAKTSLANVSTYLKQVRQECPGQMLLFDTGDFLQGQPSVYYYNYIDTVSTHVVAATYNYLGYDALGMGNHDIEAGEAVYHDRLPLQLQMPLLCANAIDTRTIRTEGDLNTGEPMFQPYAIFERSHLKIAVLGMITPHIHAWLPKALWPHLEFQDMVECAQRWVPYIQKNEKPDLIIGLFHAGGDYTVNGSDLDSYKNENGSIPAITKVPGFDICLLGHDHQERDLRIVSVAGDTVPVIDAVTQARKVGRIDVHFSRQADGSYKKQFSTRLVDMRDYAPDSAYLQTFEPIVETVNSYVDAPICKLSSPLQGLDGLVGPSAFVDLIHDTQLWATHADISLAAILSPYEVVPAGTVTMRHLFTLYKYENQLFTISMTADEVRRYLEYGYSMQYNTMHSASDHLLLFSDLTPTHPRLATPTFNYTSAAGIRYEVDVTQEPGNRVRLISMSDGAAIDPDKLYRVAINSYQYSGGGNFIPDGLGWDSETLESRTLDTTPIDVRRYLARYLATMQEVQPHLRGDWQVVPQTWWKAAKDRDIKFMHANQR
ncbi:MAG: 5'-nucleotidase C-terminal domain-containing protein [Bacteroidales bacterium]|nr:5'-nucleotidase C-terminal domain-containing protein [Bacteroidales bacterium]